MVGSKLLSRRGLHSFPPLLRKWRHSDLLDERSLRSPRPLRSLGLFDKDSWQGMENEFPFRGPFDHGSL